MYIDQRIYTMQPGKMAAWLKNYEEYGEPCLARHSGPLLGLFTVDVGPLNRVVFLRAYDDIDIRERALAALGTDPDWATFRDAAIKIDALIAQENKFLKPMPFSPIQSAAYRFERRPPASGLYVEHHTYDFHPDKMDAWINIYYKFGLPAQQRQLGQFLLFAVTDCGPLCQAVAMWGYATLGSRERQLTLLAADPDWKEFQEAARAVAALKQQTTMLLKPASSSPIR